jgi:hypothetical protein
MIVRTYISSLLRQSQYWICPPSQHDPLIHITRLQLALPPSGDPTGNHRAARRQGAPFALPRFPLQPYPLHTRHLQRTLTHVLPHVPNHADRSCFQSVTIRSLGGLQHFVHHVPANHALHIRSLDISTAANTSNAADITQAACSDALCRILYLTPRLRTLSLHLSTELSPLAISSFSKLEQLTDLAVEPCRDAIHSSL